MGNETQKRKGDATADIDHNVRLWGFRPTSETGTGARFKIETLKSVITVRRSIHKEAAVGTKLALYAIKKQLESEWRRLYGNR